jgi:hypothetical protein
VHLVVKDDWVEVNHQDRALNDRMVVVVDENVDVANSVVDHHHHHHHYDIVNEDYDVVDQSSSFA